MTVTVSSLFTYPLKSGSALAHDRLHLATDAISADRRWMVVQDDGPRAGHFLTQRDKGCEKLSLVQMMQAAVSGHHVLRAPGMPDLDVYDADKSAQRLVTLWGETMHAADEGDKAAAWFSTYLDRPARLVQNLSTARRTAPATTGAQEFSGFADGYPLLATSNSSLAALNAHIADEQKVTMARFRPNIVLSGDLPFAEDTYALVGIGTAVLEFVKPCSRCKITTIDQDMGAMTSPEPLTTLAKLRRGKGDGIQGVFFGQNVVVRQPGLINVGDHVEILTTQPLHPALAQAVLKAQPV
jgi:uncharacterized protein YcbX